MRVQRVDVSAVKFLIWDHSIALRLGVVSHIEDHPHVVRGAVAANTSVKISGVGSGDEVIGVAWLEFQPTGSGTEGPEGDGEVEEPLGPVADGHNLGPGTRDPAVHVLLSAHAVDDMLLFRARADNVQLIVLPGQVTTVHIHHMVCIVCPENRIG